MILDMIVGSRCIAKGGIGGTNPNLLKKIFNLLEILIKKNSKNIETKLFHSKNLRIPPPPSKFFGFV